MWWFCSLCSSFHHGQSTNSSFLFICIIVMTIIILFKSYTWYDCNGITLIRKIELEGRRWNQQERRSARLGAKYGGINYALRTICLPNLMHFPFFPEGCLIFVNLVWINNNLIFAYKSWLVFIQHATYCWYWSAGLWPSLVAWQEWWCTEWIWSASYCKLEDNRRG